jgi:hypothetical protein
VGKGLRKRPGWEEPYSTQRKGPYKKPHTFHEEGLINPRRSVGQAEEQPNQLGVSMRACCKSCSGHQVADTETQEDSNVELPVCWAGCVEKMSVHVCTTRPV